MNKYGSGHASAVRILRDVPVKVEELSERDSRKAMRELFGQDDGFPDSEFDDTNWSVLDDLEMKPSRIERKHKKGWPAND